MNEASYVQRRGELQDYFDRTAIEAWKKLATEEPLSRIRATVRAGRDQMRAALLSYLPQNLTGWRVLDAGCGTGSMSAELAARGAHVVGIDLSPGLIEYAQSNMPINTASGRVTFIAGDMLNPPEGGYDAVVAMDSLIHYGLNDVTSALSNLAAQARKKVVFTFAPRTLPLAVMHAAGRAFPRSDRAPAIVPIKPETLNRAITDFAGLDSWEIGATRRIKSGFYTSQALELIRT